MIGMIWRNRPLTVHLKTVAVVSPKNGGMVYGSFLEND